MEYAHPKDHKKISKKLPAIGIAFLLIVIIGLLSSKDPELKYTISVADMQKAVLDRADTISPEEAVKYLHSNSPEYRFIDLRNPQDFINGHVDGAINIPQHNILSEEYKDIWNDESKTNIIYANSHDQACGPWMLLKQLGHNNNRILMGGYNFFKDNVKEDFSVRSKNYLDEKPKYDFAKIVKETAGSMSAMPKSTAKKPGPVVRRKRKKSASGGCG